MPSDDNPSDIKGKLDPEKLSTKWKPKVMRPEGYRPHAPWRPGNSGLSPKKRVNPDSWLVAKCKELGPKAINVVVKVLENEKTPVLTRLKAAEILLDRGFGRPRQSLEVGGAGGEPLSISIEINRKVTAEIENRPISLPGAIIASAVEVAMNQGEEDDESYYGGEDEEESS